MCAMRIRVTIKIILSIALGALGVAIAVYFWLGQIEMDPCVAVNASGVMTVNGNVCTNKDEVVRHVLCNVGSTGAVVIDVDDSLTVAVWRDVFFSVALTGIDVFRLRTLSGKNVCLYNATDTAYEVFRNRPMSLYVLTNDKFFKAAEQDFWNDNPREYVPIQRRLVFSDERDCKTEEIMLKLDGENRSGDVVVLSCACSVPSLRLQFALDAVAMVGYKDVILKFFDI